MVGARESLHDHILVVRSGRVLRVPLPVVLPHVVLTERLAETGEVRVIPLETPLLSDVRQDHVELGPLTLPVLDQEYLGDVLVRHASAPRRSTRGDLV